MPKPTIFFRFYLPTTICAVFFACAPSSSTIQQRQVLAIQKLDTSITELNKSIGEYLNRMQAYETVQKQADAKVMEFTKSMQSIQNEIECFSFYLNVTLSANERSNRTLEYIVSKSRDAHPRLDDDFKQLALKLSINEFTARCLDRLRMSARR